MKKQTSLTLVAGLALLLAGCENSTAPSKTTHKAESSIKTEQVKSKQAASSTESSIASSINSTNTDQSVSVEGQSTAEPSKKAAKQTQTQQFSTKAQAASYVTDQGYQTSQETQGLPVVNLGHGITGTLDSGAGQSYLHWNEGNWSFTVRASAVNGQDPTNTAKEIVNQLETTYLPAPQNQGSGTFDIATGNYQLTWQKNNQVYSVTGNSPQDVIQKAVNQGNN